MKGAIRIITVANIPVYLHWSFSLLLFYILYFGKSNGMDWQGTALVGVLFMALFVCVVLHEFGHALTARHYGVETKDIILSPLGGIARLNKLPEKPMQEFFVAAAGPLVNFIIALVLSSYFLIYNPSDLFDNFSGRNQVFSSWVYLIPMLVVMNVALGVFNLLPAFPLDGGRILRALLAIRLGRVRATRIASFLGQALAIAFCIIGFYNMDIILGFIGIFVFLMASYEYKIVKMDSLLAGHQVTEIMRTDFTKVTATDELSSSIDLLKKGLEKDFLVINPENGGVTGVLTEAALVKAIKEKDNQSTVEKYQLTSFEKIPLTDTLQAVFRKMQDSESNIFPVYDDEKLVGVITLELITYFLNVQEKTR